MVLVELVVTVSNRPGNDRREIDSSLDDIILNSIGDKKMECFYSHANRSQHTGTSTRYAASISVTMVKKKMEISEW